MDHITHILRDHFLEHSIHIEYNGLHHGTLTRHEVSYELIDSLLEAENRVSDKRLLIVENIISDNLLVS